MRVTVLTIGSRGDAQPYAALARGLAAAGHDVTLAASARFAWLADDAGVEFRGLAAEPLKAYAHLGSRRGLTAPDQVWREARRQLLAALEEWDAAVAGADLVLAHPQVFAAPLLARRHGAAVAFASTLPVSCPTRAYPCCYLFGRSLGGAANALSYRIIPTALTPLRGWAREWFRRRGHEPPPGGRWDLADGHGRPIPHLHGHSEWVLPRPPDWPPEWTVTGYWRLEPPAGWAPDPALAAFLDAGPPPVYVGFGSMVHKGDRAALTRRLVTPLLDRGVRVLLVRGWALDDAAIAAGAPVHFIDAYEGPWHSWLFERVRAVVHHGGPGTFGAALHAGRPQLCCPFAMDQPFWAHRAQALGVAPPPLPLPSFSTGAWEARLTSLLREGRHADTAREVAGRLASEDGVARAVEAVERVAARRLPPRRGSG